MRLPSIELTLSVWRSSLFNSREKQVKVWIYSCSLDQQQHTPLYLLFELSTISHSVFQVTIRDKNHGTIYAKCYLSIFDNTIYLCRLFLVFLLNTSFTISCTTSVFRHRRCQRACQSSRCKAAMWLTNTRPVASKRGIRRCWRQLAARWNGSKWPSSCALQCFNQTLVSLFGLRCHNAFWSTR